MTEPPKILVKFPTRSRPAMFLSTFLKWYQDQSVRFLVTIDADDPTMFNPDMMAKLGGTERLELRVGHCKGKIDAINDGVAEQAFDVVIVASDDMIPQRADYGSYLASVLLKHFPDTDGVVHQNDGLVGRRLNTLPVIGRKWFDRTGWIYAPHYVSVFADNELQQVAEREGRTVYLDECVVRHEWVGSRLRDPLHRRNDSFTCDDRITFHNRKAAGFPVRAPK